MKERGSGTSTPLLACSDHGAGPPVVALHGIPGSARSWDRVVARLGQHRVLIPDLLGFGKSPDAPAGTHAIEQASAVLAMLDHAGISAAHIVGFDFGGPVAIAMHRLAPERINALTLIATNLLSDTPVPLPLQVARVPILGDLAFRAMFSRPGLSAIWRGATGDRHAFPLEAFRASIDDRGNATSRRIFLESLRRLRPLYAPIEAELPRVRVPVTVIWGDRDPFFPIAVGEKTAARFQTTRFVLLDGAGHFVPQERPDEVAAAIAATLSARHGPSSHPSAQCGVDGAAAARRPRKL